MKNLTNSMKVTGNILYNNVVQIPFSIVKGLMLSCCFPSHFNYLHQKEKHGLVSEVYPGIPNPSWVRTPQTEKKELFANHYYEKIQSIGERLLKGKSDLEQLSIVPQHIALTAISACSVGGWSLYQFSEHGLKGLIPIATTMGLSLIHELAFNKKLKNLDNTLNK